MIDFLRYPSTPYLAAPDDLDVRSDKVLSDERCHRLLDGAIVVEEKIDGENLGLSLLDGEVRAQARGDYVDLGGRHFRGLASWLEPRRHRLTEDLPANLTLFGEWCADAHAVRYDRLPDWLLVFDVLDRDQGSFWSAERRNALVRGLGLTPVPQLAFGQFSMPNLLKLRDATSRVGSELMEGVVIRREAEGFLVDKAKLVRPGFSQAIGEHWQSARRTPNRLATHQAQPA